MNRIKKLTLLDRVLFKHKIKLVMSDSNSIISGLMRALGYGASAKGRYDEAKSYEEGKSKKISDEEKAQAKKYQAAGDLSKAAGGIFDVISKLLR